MATDIVAAARGWIGTPYQHQASLKGAGCDCLGLLRGVWRELFGPEPEMPPPYAGDWAEGGRETLRDALARHLNAVPLAAMAPPPVAPMPILLPPISPPAGLMTPPAMLRCLKLSPCSSPISASPAKMPTS